MKIVDFGHEFHVSWDPGRRHKQKLAALRALPLSERRYIKPKKYWWVSGYCRDVILRLQREFNAEIIIPARLRPEIVGDVPPLPDLVAELPLKGVLRPYQRQGTAAMMEYRQIMNGDEQGLGKTFQAIAAIVGLNEFPCLVVCPGATKYNWQREWQRFTDKRVIVLDSSMSQHQKKNWHKCIEVGLADVVIINYESIPAFFIDSYPKDKSDAGKALPWNSRDVQLRPCVGSFKAGILDESQRCKDPGTNQSKFVLRLFAGLGVRFLLSGTPIINKPRDLWPQLAIMGKLHLFGGKNEFLERYCEGGNGASHLQELHYLLRKNGCFFRREKKEVATDLPEKQRQTLICDITTRDEYDKAERDLKRWLQDAGYRDGDINKKMGGEALVRLNVLRQISARGKLREVAEFTRQVLESGEKLVLFCNLLAIVDELLVLFPNAVTVTGRDSDKQKQANIDAFQHDPRCQLIICNIKAGGVGTNLTTSSRVALVEYPLTPADCVQCEDRCHRIGAKNNVMCTYFNGRDTVDERIWEIIMEKQEIANEVTGSKDTLEMEVVNKALSLFDNLN